MDVLHGPFLLYRNTIVPDYYGDIIILHGMDLSGYLANPILLLNHDYAEPPIGTVGSVILNEAGLWAEEVAILYENSRVHDYLKSGDMSLTIGFSALETARGIDGSVFFKTRLLEVSAIMSNLAVHGGEGKRYVR